MKLIAVFGQRKCQYPGQYAPELIAAATESEYADYPDYIDGNIREADKSGQFTAISSFEIEGDTATIEKRLNEMPVAMVGKITDKPS